MSRSGTLSWFPRAAITNCHNLGDLKGQESIVSQFRRLQVGNQGVGRAVLSLKPGGRLFPHLLASGNCGQSLYCLACRCVSPSLSSCGDLLCVSVSLSKFSFSYKDNSHIRCRATLHQCDFISIPSAKSVFPNEVTVTGSGLSE